MRYALLFTLAAALATPVNLSAQSESTQKPEQVINVTDLFPVAGKTDYLVPLALSPDGQTLALRYFKALGKGKKVQAFNRSWYEWFETGGKIHFVDLATKKLLYSIEDGPEGYKFGSRNTDLFWYDSGQGIAAVSYRTATIFFLRAKDGYKFHEYVLPKGKVENGFHTRLVNQEKQLFVQFYSSSWLVDVPPVPSLTSNSQTETTTAPRTNGSRQGRLARTSSVREDRFVGRKIRLPFGWDITPDGRFAITARSGQVWACDMRGNKKLIAQSRQNKTYSNRVSVSPDGTKLAVEYNSTGVEAFDLKTGKSLRYIPRAAVRGFIQGKPAILVVSAGKQILWNLHKGTTEPASKHFDNWKLATSSKPVVGIPLWVYEKLDKRNDQITVPPKFTVVSDDGKVVATLYGHNAGNARIAGGVLQIWNTSQSGRTSPRTAVRMR